MANLKIKLVKSLNGRLEKHIATANSLGLRKIGQEVVQHAFIKAVTQTGDENADEKVLKSGVLFIDRPECIFAFHGRILSFFLDSHSIPQWKLIGNGVRGFWI